MSDRHSEGVEIEERCLRCPKKEKLTAKGLCHTCDSYYSECRKRHDKVHGRDLSVPEYLRMYPAKPPPPQEPFAVTQDGELIGGFAVFGEKMRKLAEKIRRIASADVNVIITGESGVGKELVARAIHEFSVRCKKLYGVIDCPGLTPTLAESELFGHETGAFTGATRTTNGLFGDANGGSIFIDELSALEMSIQPKLLRVLESRRYRRVGSTKYEELDVRIIAATNEPLEKLVEEKRLRPDLLYRLGVVTIDVPPLRERAEEIPELARYLLANFSPGRTPVLEEGAVSALRKYPWPGNVREMRNALSYATLFADDGSIGPHALPEKIVAAV